MRWSRFVRAHRARGGEVLLTFRLASSPTLWVSRGYNSVVRVVRKVCACVVHRVVSAAREVLVFDHRSAHTSRRARWSRTRIPPTAYSGSWRKRPASYPSNWSIGSATGSGLPAPARTRRGHATPRVEVVPDPANGGGSGDLPLDGLVCLGRAFWGRRGAPGALSAEGGRRRPKAASSWSRHGQVSRSAGGGRGPAVRGGRRRGGAGERSVAGSARAILSAVEAQRRRPANRSWATMTMASHASLCTKSSNGKLRRPLALAHRMRSSTQAWRRWRSSRGGGSPAERVRKQVWREPSEVSHSESWAPGWAARAGRSVGHRPGLPRSTWRAHYFAG